MKKMIRRMLIEYNPKYVYNNIKRLHKVGLFNRLMFGVLIGNSSIASTPYISAAVGVAFDKGMGASILALIGIGYQFGKFLAPMFKGMKMSLLLKVFMCVDVLSVLIVYVSIFTNNDKLLIIGLELMGMLTIGMSFQYGTQLQRYMARDELRTHIPKYSYTANTLDILAKLIIGGSVALVSVCWSVYGLVLSSVLVVGSMYFQIKFMKEVESKGY